MTRRLALVAAVVFAAALLGLPARATEGAQTTADEPHYLLTALSLWEDQSFDYGDERAELRYWPFHSAILPIQAELRADGSRVAPHDPLLPVLLAVPMGLGGWVGAKVAMAMFAAALGAVLAWVLEHRARVRSRTAAVAAVLAGCSPPLAVYATQIYPELPGALAALAAFACITTPHPRWRTVSGAVVGLVALPWLSVKYAPVAVVLAIGLAVSLRGRGRRRLMLGAGIALAVSGLCFAPVHLALYGGLTPYAAGTHFGDGELSVMGSRPDYVARAARVTGLVVDRHFGLASWQPLYLLVLPAVVVWAARRAGPGRALLPLTFGAGWVTATFLALTMHGLWWPGRQTVVVLPLGIVAIVAWIERSAPRIRRWAVVVAALGPWMFLWLIGGVLARRHTLIFDFENTLDPIGGLLRLALPDLRADTRTQDALHVAWGSAIAVFTLVSARIEWRAREPGQLGAAANPRLPDGRVPPSASVPSGAS